MRLYDFFTAPVGREDSSSSPLPSNLSRLNVFGYHLRHFGLVLGSSWLSERKKRWGGKGVLIIGLTCSLIHLFDCSFSGSLERGCMQLCK